MKLSAILLAATLGGATLLPGEEKAEYSEEQFYDAKVLFAEFSRMLRANPEKAAESFDAIVALPDPLRARVGGWLDQQWAKSKRAYWLDQSLSGAGEEEGKPAALNASQRLILRENRSLLEEIRGIADENEMKKRLRDEGWEALGELVRTTNPKAAMKFQGDPEEQQAAPVDPALERALVFGHFRHQMRQARDQESLPPEEELAKERQARAGFGDESPEEAKQADEEEIAIYHGKAGSVLRANAALKSEVPRDEYDGILELNHWRIALGLNPLLIDPKLCDAARDHSEDMAKLGFFAHESPVEGKKTPWDRAKNFGTSGRAENIAINGSTSGANQAWFYSPGHHKNMFAKHSYVGLGASGRHFTQMFR